MPTILSHQHLKHEFKKARDLLGQAMMTFCLEDLKRALTQFHSAKDLAITIRADWMLAEGMSKVRGVFKFDVLIKQQRENKLPDGFFQAVLTAFEPNTYEITNQEKSKIDVDELLVRSMLRHSCIDSTQHLLRYFGMNSSRKAFALVLDDYLKQLNYAIQNDEPLNERVAFIPLLNGYKTPARANEALPSELFSVLEKYPEALLSEHLHKKHGNQGGGYLKLEILQGLMKRAAGNEKLLDVIEEIAGASFFQLHHIEHAVWLEDQGLKIHYEIAQRVLTSTSSLDAHQKAAFYYMLMSSSYPLSEVDRTIRMTARFLGADEYVKILRLACQRNAEQPGQYPEFGEKVTALVKAYLKRNEPTAMAMLDLPDLPREALIRDDRVREKLMAGDLGL